MKKILLFIFIGITFCQEYEDVVYLKNGSIIHGMIIEQAPNRYIKIQSGKNIFVYQMDEIEKITKELATSINDISSDNWSIAVGLGTNKSPNFIQLSKDIKLSKNSGLLVFTGFGVFFGFGITVQSNYNNNGIIMGWTWGVNPDDDKVWRNISIAYQWRLNNSNTFFSLGITAVARGEDSPFGGSSKISTFNRAMPIPVISFDHRF